MSVDHSGIPVQLLVRVAKRLNWGARKVNVFAFLDLLSVICFFGGFDCYILHFVFLLLHVSRTVRKMLLKIFVCKYNFIPIIKIIFFIEHFTRKFIETFGEHKVSNFSIWNTRWHKQTNKQFTFATLWLFSYKYISTLYTIAHIH